MGGGGGCRGAGGLGEVDAGDDAAGEVVQPVVGRAGVLTQTTVSREGRGGGRVARGRRYERAATAIRESRNGDTREPRRRYERAATAIREGRDGDTREPRRR